MNFLVFAVWVALAYSIANNVGRKREIGFTKSLILCILLSPILGLIFSLLSPEIESYEIIAQRHKEDRETKLKTRKQKATFFNQQYIEKKVNEIGLEPIKIDDRIIDTLISKSWDIVDNSTDKKNLTFRQNRDLLLDHNGSIGKYNWDYLKSKNGIMLDRESRIIIYNVFHFNEDQIILANINSGKKSFMLLSNDHNSEKDIKTFLSRTIRIHD